MRGHAGSPIDGCVPIGAGLVWLWCASSFGIIGFFFSVIPGCLLLSSGVSTLLYPGDPRIPQFTAAGGLLGVPLALPVLLVGGVWLGLTLILLSALSFLAAGRIAVRQEPHTEGVPEPIPSSRLAAQAAIDDAILASVSVRMSMGGWQQHERIRAEVHAARELFRGRGWLEQPVTYHAAPPPLGSPTIERTHAGRYEFEHVRFDSDYEPSPDEPGRERWLSYVDNRIAHAWVMRHASQPRPWLVCIHGYEMGGTRLDLAAFQANRLHRRHGLNLLLPILPLHGPRKIGRRSGTGFLSGNFIDTIHAEAQAMWDMRRLLAWIRTQGDEPVGVYGLSLGGYNAALLACVDDRLACAIAGIPAVDFTRLTWRHGPPLHIRSAERRGLVHDEVSEVLRVISPLAMAPHVPREGRYIFAGLADRLVPPDQPRDLWQHWEQPRIEWYQGAHVTFRFHPGVERLIVDALRAARLIP
jgi:dienelactone hydrolase